MNQNRKPDKKLLLILLLLLISVSFAGAAVWAVFFRDTTPVLAPDYALVEEEENAEPIPDETDGGKMEVEEGGGAVSMVYQKEITISLADSIAALLFQNPSRSVNDVVLQLAIVSGDDTETVIAQSGTIKPGNEVRTLELMEDAAILSEGTYTGRFHLLYYDPDTGERAIVNSTVEGLEITVTR